MKLLSVVLVLLCSTSIFADRRGMLISKKPITSGGGGGNGLLNNLIAVWECEAADNSDLPDATGAGLTLTRHGATVQQLTHIQGSFSDKGGGGAYWDSTSASLKMASSFTCSGWFYQQDAPVGSYAVTEYNGSIGWLIYFPSDTTMRMWTKNTGDASPITADSTVTLTTADGKWHFYVAGYDAANSRIFISVDGETLVTTSCPNGIPASPANFTFSDLTGGTGGACPVYRDESALWNKVLTQSDITTLIGTFNFGTQTGTPLLYSGGGWQN